jgi:peroxiredoxin
MKWRSREEKIAEGERRLLWETLAERKAKMAQHVPAAALEVHARAIVELRSQGLAQKALAVGDNAPQFTLPDHNGKLVSSTDLLNTGRLIVCFIRGRWDPFCCGQMEAMSQIVPAIQEAGASLVAISPQTVKQSFFMADQHRLRFPLLSDSGNAVARHFRLVYRVPDEQQTIYRRAFINLPFINGDENWELPVPATYILDGDATVLYRSATEDYTERPEPTEILEHLGGRPPES